MGHRKEFGYLLLLLFFALIAYLVVNTGLASDDFIYTYISHGKNIIDLVIPRGELVTMPVENYTHFIWFPFLTPDNSTFLNILKIFYMIMCFYCAAKFFNIYLNATNSILASFFFIFFPSHDSTVYWFIGQYATLTLAFYMYAYYLAYKNRLLSASFAAFMASFMSYASPPAALSLSFIFAANKEYKKSAVLLVPNIIYSGYYIFVTKVLSTGISRLPADIDMGSIFKQFILQALTFIDSVIGPSMWLKIYYSFGQLTVASVIIGFAGMVFLLLSRDLGANRIDRKLAAGLFIMTISSFALFAVTGYYPQLAFNMGNRTTIFGSLLLAYLIVASPMPRTARILVLSVILFSALGISDHWKAWSSHQQAVIENIRNNRDLRDYRDNRRIYVSGNQYSKFGGMSHIEFLAGDGSIAVLSAALGRDVDAAPINRNLYFDNGYLIDRKFGEKFKVEGYINVYDSERDRLFKLQASEINGYIDSLPEDKRHWAQLYDIGPIKKISVLLMPRLKYAL